MAKIYNVKTKDGLFQVPGKIIKIKGIEGRFLATRPLKSGGKDYYKEWWTLTEFQTGLQIPCKEHKTIKATIKNFEADLTETMIKSYPQLLKDCIKKYGIANI
jgi:hypothetical protein